jgi:hypothetical protein
VFCFARFQALFIPLEMAAPIPPFGFVCCRQFRKAIRLTNTMWGGRFNPIVLVDRQDDAAQLVELFRADVIVPVGDGDEVEEFSKRFPHLINPFLSGRCSSET